MAALAGEQGRRWAGAPGHKTQVTQLRQRSSDLIPLALHSSHQAKQSSFESGVVLQLWDDRDAVVRTMMQLLGCMVLQRV